MSRRCRASLGVGSRSGSAGGGSFDSGCDCARLAGAVAPEPPCVEPVVYAGNILRDPSMELTVLEFGLAPGPFGEQFPGDGGLAAGGVNPVVWADGSAYSEEAPFWEVFSNDGVGADVENRWHISNVSPRSGTYHARFVTDDNFAGGFVTNNAALMPVGFFLCSGAENRAVSAVAAPGDLLTMSVYAKASVLTDTPRLELAIDTASIGFDTANQWPSFSFPVFNLTTAYVKYTFSAFLPAGAYYIQPSFWGSLSGFESVRTVFDYDDFEVGLIQAGQSILLCAQSTLITIDNDTTETAFL